MSRIGKAIIEIPEGVEVKISGSDIHVKGPKGSLSHVIPAGISAKLEENVLSFVRENEEKAIRALHGTTRSIVASMVEGVSKGFTKQLEIIGVGYRGEQKGKNVNFLLGFSHHVLVEPPQGIELKMEGNNKVNISGVDKQLVGQVAANIRKYRKPEPYKGKGIRYTGEYVRRKEVKKS